ncbi:MAG: hypothetical protein J6P03_08730 [Opitutales bacterium]|nr:hypothetical protein [Opitutales bacterium]
MVDLVDATPQPPLEKRLEAALEAAARGKKALKLTTRSERVLVYKIAARKKIAVKICKQDYGWAAFVC